MGIGPLPSPQGRGFYERGCQEKNSPRWLGASVFLGIQPPVGYGHEFEDTHRAFLFSPRALAS